MSSFGPSLKDHVPSLNRVHVQFESNTDLHTSIDLERIYDIYKARQELKAATNITYFIKAEDLLKIAEYQGLSDGDDVFIQLKPCPKRNSKGTRRRRSFSPRSSKNDQESNSPVGTIKAHSSSKRPTISDFKASESPPRVDLESPKLGVNKKPVSLTLSDKPSNKMTTPNNEALNSIIRSMPDVIPKIQIPPQQESKFLIIHGVRYSIHYNKSEVAYAIFSISKHTGSPREDFDSLLCEGFLDSAVDSSILLNFKRETCVVTFRNRNVEVHIYGKTISKLSLPTFFLVAAMNVECTVEEFVGLLEGIMETTK